MAKLVRRYTVHLAAGLLVMAGAAVTAQDKDQREVFTAAALSTGGPQTAPVAGRVTFTIERWTTPEEARKLTTALKEAGAKKMLETLRDLKEVGTISSPGSIGYPLQYATQEPLPGGGRKILLATDRPISFAEAWQQSRTIDYPFTFIELRVDKDGKGEGKMTVAAKVIPAGDQMVVEDWSTAPVQLNDVRKQN
jgi:hypothetical protein